MPETPSPTLLAVHAHPDDETITMGGTLARYAAEGVRTVVVTCTSGDVGEISESGLATPTTLGEVRRRELAEALRILGVARSVILPYRDSGMAGGPRTRRRAPSGAPTWTKRSVRWWMSSAPSGPRSC